jgi:hypothetical protein
VELVALPLEAYAGLGVGAMLLSCMAAALKSVGEEIGAKPCGFVAQ